VPLPPLIDQHAYITFALSGVETHPQRCVTTPAKQEKYLIS